MKRSRLKILMAVLAATLLLVSAFTIISVAGDKYSEVTFVENNSSFKQAALKGEEMTIPEPKEESIGGEIYGWFDMEGNLYKPGEKFTPAGDLILYRAEGDEFALSASLPIYCQKGYTYVKLKSSISLSEPIALPEGKILYIDLNGNTINLETDAAINNQTGEEIPTGAFVGQNCGVIFANSSDTKATVNHTAHGSTDFLVNSLISVSPTSSPKNLTFVVKENVTVNTNMNFLSVGTDISDVSGAINVSVYGEVNAGRLIRSTGLETAKVTFFENSKTSFTCEYIFEDIVPDDNNVANLTIYGGVHSLKVGFIRNGARVSTLIYGGRFSRDISPLLTNGNFTFTLGSDGFYTFGGCNHSGPLAENVVSCDENCTTVHSHCACTSNHVHCKGETCTNTSSSHVHCKCTINHERHCQCLSLTNHSDHFRCDTPRKLTHRCNYCGQEYTVVYENGVGHSLKMELVQSPINTPEETQAARYRTYCTRGDFERLEYAYPDPSSVYVTVKYNEKNVDTGEITVREIRVPSLDIYSFDETLKTKILSFSVDSVYTTDENGEKIHIDPSAIFYVEVPLGTTDLYGELKNANNTPTKVGVFVNDYYIKEIALPISLVNIDNYAFCNMNSIEKITGIEYVTGTIGKEAFMQSAKTKLAFDYLELNASSVGENAFRNIIIKNSLTIGQNVSKISNNAFALDPEVIVTSENRIKEIFIVGNETHDGVKLSTAKGNMGSGHQFSDLAIVYIGHDYIKNSIPSTCISFGHDLYRCSRCFAEYKDNFVYQYTDHDFVEHIVASTCQQYGFEGTRCTVCDFKVKEKDLPIDKNNHTYAAGVVKYAIKEGGSFCVDPYYTLRQCGCGKIEADTASTVKFTFTGNTEKTVWDIFMLENGTVLIYKNGQRITSKSSASLEIEDGVIKTLTTNGVTFQMIKKSGGADTLSGQYTAFYNTNITFTVDIEIGSRINAVVPAANATHNYKETYLIEPTCVEGKVRRVCTDCKYTPLDTIVKPVQEHSREKIVLQEATCSVVESGVYKCTVCGGESPYKFEGKFDSTKHAKKDNDEGVVVAEPSSEHAGIRRFQCKDCGGDIFEEIPKVDESFSFTIPILNITINTDRRTFKTTLIIIFISIPLVAGMLLTFIFTFTKKKSKAAGYKFRFNTLKNGEGGSNKTVAEQLAEMNLVDELPPDVIVNENGERDDEAAWTAYVDAINNDYTRTMELNLQNQEENSSEDEVKPSMENAWEAYVEALNKDYEETVELSLNSEGKEEKSLSELMNDTVVDIEVEGEGDDEVLDLGTPDDEALGL